MIDMTLGKAEGWSPPRRRVCERATGMEDNGGMLNLETTSCRAHKLQVE